MTGHSGVLREHGYHSLRVKDVVEETADTRTFVFDVPEQLRSVFSYRPGQFCTVRANIAGDDVLRCYSMSSAPGVDADLAVTVKRVPGGTMSNWLHDNVSSGDELELTRPAGVFCLADTADEGARVVGFCGGSGVTPVFSIVKHILTSTQRPVMLLVANRDKASVIFNDELSRLQAAYKGRFELRHHFDVDGGYLDQATVAGFAEGCADAEVFVCGPTPFMDLVEGSLVGSGVQPARIAIERFVSGGPLERPSSGSANAAALAGADEATDHDAETGHRADATETITLILKGKRHTLEYAAGDTVLDAARRGGLKPPFSCESGNCASCMAFLSEGGATMRANNALSPAEVAEGWVLTCQAIPNGRSVTVEYENL